jgi:hypothetical protein
MDGGKSGTIIYNLTKMIIAILIIPTILVGSFCALVIFSTKNIGLPSILGYTVVQIPNNDFYNSETNIFRNGEHRMFLGVNKSDYKEGDLIAYQTATGEPQIVIDRWQWLSFNSTLQSSNNSTIQNANFIVNVSEDSEQPNVALGKIAKIGIAYDNNNMPYTCFSIYDTPTDTTDNNLILFNSVIGIAIESPDFIINFISFCASINGFIFLILIPCLFLIMLQLINITSFSKYKKETRILKRKMLREREMLIQQEEGAQLEPRLVYKVDMEKTIEKGNKASILKVIKEGNNLKENKIYDNPRKNIDNTDTITINLAEESLTTKPPKPPADFKDEFGIQIDKNKDKNN